MDALIKYREAHKLSRVELAARLGCSESYIGHIERGIRRISWQRAIKWEAKLGISREQLAPHIYRPKPARGSGKEKANA